MRCLRVLLAIPLLLFLSFGIVNSQITIPPTEDLEIKNPDGRPDYQIWGDLLWRHKQGDPLLGLWANVDSVRKALPIVDMERSWCVVIDSSRTASSPNDTITFLVTVSTKATRAKAAPVTAYKDSLDAHRVIDVHNVDFLPGIDFWLSDTTTSHLAAGDSIEIYFVRPSFDQHWIRKILLHPSSQTTTDHDTVKSPGIVTFGPVSNEFSFLNLMVLATTSSGSSSATIGGGYQIYDGSIGKWLGPGNDADRIRDSLFIIDTLMILDRGVWSLIPVFNEGLENPVPPVLGDSIKFFFWLPGGVGNIMWFEGMQIRQHN